MMMCFYGQVKAGSGVGLGMQRLELGYGGVNGRKLH